MPVTISRGNVSLYSAGSINVYSDALPAASGIFTTNLTHWYDAGNASSYGGSGTTWTNLVAGTGVNMDLFGSPTFVSNGASSYFVFNGTTQYASSSRFIAGGDRAFTLNLVCNFASLPSQFSNYRFWSDNGNPTSIRVYRETDVNRIVSMDFSQGNVNFFGDIAYTPSGNIISSSQNYMLTFVSTPTEVSLYINGTFYTASTEPFTTGTATGNQTYWFASNANAGTLLSMSIAHIMWYSSSLTAGNITQNYNALKSRYGI